MPQNDHNDNVSCASDFNVHGVKNIAIYYLATSMQQQMQRFRSKPHSELRCHITTTMMH